MKTMTSKSLALTMGILSSNELAEIERNMDDDIEMDELYEKMAVIMFGILDLDLEEYEEYKK